MASVSEIAGAVMVQCAALAPGDRVLIVTDVNKQHIARQFLDAARRISKSAGMLVMPPASLDGEEPPARIAEAMLEADIIFALTTWSLTHTKASRAAMQKGTKLISMPAVTEELVEKYVAVDYEAMKALTIALRDALSAGSTVHIAAEKGTDLTLDISGRKGIAMFGICGKGGFINLPDGEALVSPLSGNGVLVVDGSMPPDSPTKWGAIGKISTPIVLTIKDGKIVKITGGKEAGVLKRLFAEYPEVARRVAEFGIGTNPLAKVIGNVTVDEKALGTVHVAFGNSVNIGGTNDVPVHLDGVITSPTVWIDDICILQKGFLCVENPQPGT